MLISIIILSLSIKLFVVFCLLLSVGVDATATETIRKLKIMRTYDTVILDLCGYRFGGNCFLWLSGRGRRKLAAHGDNIHDVVNKAFVKFGYRQ